MLIEKLISFPPFHPSSMHSNPSNTLPNRSLNNNKHSKQSKDLRMRQNLPKAEAQAF